jgi:enoyl-CoA hydratase/3-hydroxyacyl-CoA dehydrogenase
MVEYGFVNEVVDGDALMERALNLATDLAAGLPLAQPVTKGAMLAGRTNIEAGLRAESDGFGFLWTTQDTAEGVDALMSRRMPEFKGE